MDNLRVQTPDFYSRPCGRGDSSRAGRPAPPPNFYSRPCGRGDERNLPQAGQFLHISTHAPAGGATAISINLRSQAHNFYSRPCGRGDLENGTVRSTSTKFLLTPLREGRRHSHCYELQVQQHFYSRPCGRGDDGIFVRIAACQNFYSRPCGRGDQFPRSGCCWRLYFYSRPCGRGDGSGRHNSAQRKISTHAPAGGATEDKKDG